MALAFTGASTNRVEIAASSSINGLDTLTAYGWFYPTALTDAMRWFAKAFDGSFNGFVLDFNGGTGNINWYVNRSVSNFHVTTTGNPITTNKWWFVACTYDVNAGTPGTIYVGDLATAAAAPANSTQNGSGTTAGNAVLPLTIGNASLWTGGNESNAFPGRIGMFGLLNRVATLSEIRDLQFAPRVVSGTVVFMPLGLNGTGTQPDYSGRGNNGTVTGATAAAHVPMRPLFGTRSVRGASRVISAFLAGQPRVFGQGVQSSLY